MKRMIIICCLLCACTGIPGTKALNLPQHHVVGLRDGYVDLRTGQRLVFRDAIVTANTTMIRIESEMIRQTVLWVNVNRVYIVNDTSIDGLLEKNRTIPLEK
mgnify:CR=1 FL=1